jgi:hypothetical protein
LKTEILLRELGGLCFNFGLEGRRPGPKYVRCSFASHTRCSVTRMTFYILSSSFNTFIISCGKVFFHDMTGACADAKGMTGVTLDFPEEEVHEMLDCLANIDNGTINLYIAP